MKQEDDEIKRKRKDDPNPKNLYPRGDSWILDFYIRGRRYTEILGSVSRSRAKEIRDQRRTKIAEGELAVDGMVWKNRLWVREVQEVPFEDPLFPDAMQKFLDWYKTENADYTYKKYASPSAKNLKAFFDEYRLSQITLMLIEKYKRDRKTGCTCAGGPKRENPSEKRCAVCIHFCKSKSDVTVNRELMILRHMINKMIDFKMAKFNPFRTVTKLEDGTYRVERVKLFKELGRERYLSEEDAERLLAECNEDLRLVVMTAMYTGFRDKELKSLAWINLDLILGSATVINAYSKNGETGTVPLPDDLIRALRKLKEERKPKPHDLVFTHDGKVWKSWREAFDGAVKRAGIENFHFHDCRHCYGSWLAKVGVAFENRQKLMRHRDPKMTMRYTHLDAESRREAVNKLPSFNIQDSESQRISQQPEFEKVVAFGK
jgi:integrase